MSSSQRDEVGSAIIVGGIMLTWLLAKRRNRKSARLTHILESFDTLEPETLRGIMFHLIEEMEHGLKKDKTGTQGTHKVKGKEQDSLAMIPSYVTHLPTGSETGTFIAVDMGGSTIRTRRIKLQDGKLKENQMIDEDCKIPQNIMKAPGTGKDLFGFIAERVKNALPEGQTEAQIGFTFSFPIQQQNITSGILLQWTKEIETEGVVNKDVVQLFQTALRENGMDDVNVTAICNDTVGTLVAGMYHFPQEAEKVVGGLIVGTGSNMAYWEKASNIVKLPPEAQQCGHMIINMEWGNFDEREKVLPLNEYDMHLNEKSDKVGFQLFEKMISGVYIGELCRCAVEDYLVSDWNWGKSSLLTQEGILRGEDVSAMAHDDTSNLVRIDDIFRTRLSSRLSYDAKLGIKKIVQAVFRRAARLLAVGVAAIAQKTRRQNDCIVAVDGSVYEHNPLVQKELSKGLDDIFGKHGISMRIVPNASVIGPALIAALEGKVGPN